MSDFHDSDYYKRQRIIFHGIVNFVAFTGIISSGLILVFHLLFSLHITQRDLEGSDTFFFVFMVAMFFGVFYFYRINTQLEKFDANVLKQKDQSKALGTQSNSDVTSTQITPNKSISDFQELIQAISDKQISEDGRLLVNRAEFVRYCEEHNFFPPRNIESSWKPIEFLLKDQKSGKLLKAKKFSQTYQDLARNGKI